jgi:hypothetical protein
MTLQARTVGPDHGSAASTVAGLTLEARDLCLRFGALEALKTVSLGVAGHEIHSVIGPNGAGSRLESDQDPSNRQISLRLQRTKPPIRWV